MATQVRKQGAWHSGSASPVGIYPSLNRNDQMHGVYRGPWNTGVPYGTTLLPQVYVPSFGDGLLDGLSAQGITVTKDGNGFYKQILIDRVNWVGVMSIATNTLTQPSDALSPWIKVTNSLFTACSDTGSVDLGQATLANAGDMTFQNCSFINKFVGQPAFNGSITLQYCDAMGGADNIHFHLNTIVTDSYIHEPWIGLGVHSDLLQDLSGTHPNGVIIQRNRLELFTLHRYTNHMDPHNRVIHGDYPGQLTLTDNYMDGGTYCVDGGPGGTQITANNRFGRYKTYTIFYNQASAGRFNSSDVFQDTNVTVITDY